MDIFWTSMDIYPRTSMDLFWISMDIFHEVTHMGFTVLLLFTPSVVLTHMFSPFIRGIEQDVMHHWLGTYNSPTIWLVQDYSPFGQPCGIDLRKKGSFAICRCRRHLW